MTRIDEDPGKRRGKTKQFRGRTKEMSMHDAYFTRDFTWPFGGKPSNLSAFNEIPGHWTYPKKGFIQWKMQR